MVSSFKISLGMIMLLVISATRFAADLVKERQQDPALLLDARTALVAEVSAPSRQLDSVLLDETQPLANTPAESVAFLQDSFCTPRLCADGNWQQWIEVAESDPWNLDALIAVQQALSVTITALDEAGLDGQALLQPYRFRYQEGEYTQNEERWNGYVNHDGKMITLADSAFKRHHGFTLLHELGHVVDRQSARRLSRQYHALAGSPAGGSATADGFWLNPAGQADREEATADAFATWIGVTYQGHPRPIFWKTPVDTDYDLIMETIQTSVARLAEEPSAD
jgi:hypothetical protein